MLVDMRGTPTRQKTKYGNIFKVKNGHYHVRISVKNLVSGKFQKKSEEVYGTLDDALQRQMEMKRENKLTTSAVSGWTMSDLGADYFTYIEGKLAPGTVRSDRGRWQIMDEVIGDVKAKTFVTRDASLLRDHLLRGRDITNATANTYMSVLSRMFEYGMVHGVRTDNPMKNLPRLRKNQLVKKEIDQEVVTATLEMWAEKNPAYARFLWLAMMIGARRSEVCGLRIGDFDPVTHKLTISRGVKMKEGGGYIIGPTKAHNQRTFTVDPIAAGVIVEQADALHARLGGVKPDHFLFSDAGIDPWLPDRLTQAIYRTKKEMKVDFKIKDLRSLSTTVLRSNPNVPKAYTQMRGGWENGDVMDAHYFYAQEADAVQAHEALKTLLPVQRLLSASSVDDSSRTA